VPVRKWHNQPISYILAEVSHAGNLRLPRASNVTRRAIAMAPSPINNASAVRQISEEQSLKIFESAAQYFLGISASQFLTEWKSGKLSNSDEPGISEVASLIPPSFR
jgi:hypothetical protein